MLALANQIIGLLSTIAVGIVTALAVQDAVGSAARLSRSSRSALCSCFSW
jgi:hypothetical protein